mmetsp:Transcript_20553/g.50048  ORF Transcript_20553/g.50048 Transcript_20553/m.50048 type:complete len:210 (+) Transcript_20553:407-1036(+)
MTVSKTRAVRNLPHSPLPHPTHTHRHTSTPIYRTINVGDSTHQTVRLIGAEEVELLHVLDRVHHRRSGPAHTHSRASRQLHTAHHPLYQRYLTPISAKVQHHREDEGQLRDPPRTDNTRDVAEKRQHLCEEQSESQDATPQQHSRHASIHRHPLAIAVLSVGGTCFYVVFCTLRGCRRCRGHNGSLVWAVGELRPEGIGPSGGDAESDL